jgi:hypothetical protein
MKLGENFPTNSKSSNISIKKKKYGIYMGLFLGSIALGSYLWTMKSFKQDDFGKNIL